MRDNADPADSDIDRIVRAVRLVVMERSRKLGLRRDVHLKHHGLVWGWFRVRDSIPPQLARGVFRPGAVYPVWIRFSNSSKLPRPDSVADGRGIAIKLLDVDGPRFDNPAPQPRTQDFLCLNGPAFFTRNAAEMAIVAELEAKDEFPSLFFASPARLRGLAALQAMVNNQAASPVDNTYFSQTPYRLWQDEQRRDGLLVKYRVRPALHRPAPESEEAKHGAPESPGRAPEPKGAHYLYEALKHRLAPSDPPIIDDRERGSDVVLSFGVQVAGADAGTFPEDDATRVWDEHKSPFVEIADIRIPRQHFDSVRRMELAEKISFNPWNTLVFHEPVGSLNRARKRVYAASAELRNAKVPTPSYTREEWDEYRRLPATPRWKPGPVRVLDQRLNGLVALGALIPKFFAGVEAALRSRYGYWVAPLLLGFFMFVGWYWPSTFCGPLTLDLSLVMPSEQAIPKAIFKPSLSEAFRTDERERLKNIKWTFRYMPTGSEYAGGLPYWIYRVLPRMFPAHFGGRRDWSSFGLGQPDDQEFYIDYHGLPRGLVMSDTTVHVAGSDLRVTLKRVSFNCASCHRGEYLTEAGHSRFADGMPNTVLDTAGFKRAAFLSITSEDFRPDSVIAAIDQLLVEENHEKLTPTERFLYRQIVQRAKQEASEKPIGWMTSRPDNGPGRLDAFGALRFEFMKYPNDTSVTTVDLPSIWHQSPEWRPWHHYDGNTAHQSARNFGAIVGVGGIPASIHRREVDRVGKWIDDELEPPPYPFDTSAEAIKKGKLAYEARCSKCHGSYSDVDGKLERLTDCMKKPQPINTDPMRAQAIDPVFVDRLNAFGANAGIWDTRSFRSTQGYSCPPLDGIWARAPYLHNGSVPTLWHLLGPVAERPKRFLRGNPAYDAELGGFAWSGPSHRQQFEYVTDLPGNSNLGHDGTDQLVEDETERRHLIAYLQTL